MENVVFAMAGELAEAIRQRQISAVEVLDAYLAQVDRHNPALNAIVTLDREGARQRAQAADDALAKGEIWGPLHGVPITLKDIFDTAGVRSAMGQQAMADRVPTEDSLVAARLKAAGSILLGKTNAQIFPDNPFGQTHNPWDLERSPGTSSSGSAAALAAGLTALDVGSDATGSVLAPSHFSGVYGIRPTERRIPLERFPTDPVQIWRAVMVLGPMARSVEDLSLAMQILARPDARESEVPPVLWRQAPRPKLRDLRIAWTSTFPGTIIASEIRTAMEGLAIELGRQGARLEECLPGIDLNEQSQFLSQLVGILVGSFADPPALLADYFTALQRRDGFIATWEQFFEDWDVFLCPVHNITAHRYTEDVVTVDGNELNLDEISSPINLSPATGLPAVVVPLARDSSGLPMGVQLIGRRWEDEKLLAIAGLISEITGGFHRPPGY
jgi:amidase